MVEKSGVFSPVNYRRMKLRKKTTQMASVEKRTTSKVQ